MIPTIFYNRILNRCKKLSFESGYVFCMEKKRFMTSCNHQKRYGHVKMCNHNPNYTKEELKKR